VTILYPRGRRERVTDLGGKLLVESLVFLVSLFLKRIRAAGVRMALPSMNQSSSP
jgi:hypothetical protein